MQKLVFTIAFISSALVFSPRLAFASFHPCAEQRCPDLPPPPPNMLLGDIPVDRCVQRPYCPPAKKRELEEAAEVLNAMRCDVKDGNMFSAVWLGEAYLKGRVDCHKIPQDFWRSLYWYRQAAECGITLAMIQVGNFYRDGIGMDPCPWEAKCWYERAANLGDVTAMLSLAEMYKGWHGITRDEKQAMYWYQRACNCGSGEAEFQIGLLLTKRAGAPGFCEGVDLIVKAAEEGNPAAISALGDLYYEGRMGGCRNLQAARQHYECAAGLGYAEAAFKLGMMYASGQGVPRSHQEVAKWMLLAAQGGYPAAEMYLGDLYREGIGVPRNYKFAVMWYTKAAQHGVLTANVTLADLFLTGKGVPRILEQAAHLYEVTSENKGDPYADLMLSVMYSSGWGVSLDLEKSVFYYQRAKKKSGFLMAEYKIARRYALGGGLPFDMNEAMRWYIYAAEKGLPVAAVELGDVYYTGAECVPQNYAKAYLWYRKAALQGNSYAQYMVGMMIYLKQVDECEEKVGTALAWLRKAAYQGARQAQYQLGLMNLQGLGIPVNNVQAYAWFKIALACVEDAPSLEIKGAINVMGPDARSKAVELARKYQSKYAINVQYPTR